jgi:hypothetical protein
MVDPALGFAFPAEAAPARLSAHRQRPVERTTAMDIAMLALALGFFAAALAYVSACSAL